MWLGNRRRVAGVEFLGATGLRNSQTRASRITGSKKRFLTVASRIDYRGFQTEMPGSWSKSSSLVTRWVRL